MITTKVWYGVVAVGVGLAVAVSAVNDFVPGLEDLGDPLGRPSKLSDEVIHSASEFDRISGILVPKHGNISAKIQKLNTVADNLDGLVGKAGGLGTAAVRVNQDTTSVQGVATPLPSLINKVTGRAKQGTSSVAKLNSTVGSVNVQLQAIGDELDGVKDDLAVLGPRADSIDSVLAQIQEESERVKLLGPVLGLVGPIVNDSQLNPVLSELLSGG